MKYLKALIIDDSQMIRLQARKLLPQGNFEILEAADGLEGLELIQRSHPNFVLIDFYMPHMNGLEVVRAMQADAKLHSVPVVMMSGRLEEVEKAAPDLFDYFGVLKKPFDQTLLLRAIKSATQKAKERRNRVLTEKQALLQKQAAVERQALAEKARHPATTLAAPPAKPLTAEFLIKELQTLRQQNAQLQEDLDWLKFHVAQITKLMQRRS